MYVGLMLLTILAVLLLVFVLVKYLTAIIALLNSIGGKGDSYLAKLRLGLRAIETETGHLPTNVIELNKTLTDTAGGLKVVDEHLVIQNSKLSRMPQAVFVLWTILLLVTVLLLPFIVNLLHRTWKASRNIERYFKEMKEAGFGVAGNTEHVKALDDTIGVASGMLDVAGDINAHAEALKGALADRASTS